jgi:anaerobic magnesium-protoporphyrin IX monomethyl ester cyclase
MEEFLKIALIEPRIPGGNIYSKISMPLLGPVYLGTILRNRGHEVTIYNERIRMPDYARLEADVVGISILTSTAQRGYEIAKKFPREKVILGGVHASLLPEEATAYARQVVVGEAEEVIVDVVEGRRKEPIVQGRAVENLDALPFPDFSLIQGFPKVPPVTPISTSRGCPFDCSFCSVTKMFGRKYRFRSPENIMSELTSRTAKSLFFCDDNFTANPKRSQTLLDMMLQRRLPKWSCQVRCDVARDSLLLNKMVKAGCRHVCIGFESVNPQTLKAYNKSQTLEEIISSIRLIRQRKIKIHGMFVLGGEHDNKKTVWETLRFALKQRIDTIQMTILTPFPGTKVFEALEAQKRIFTKDWRLYDGQHIVFSPKLLSAKELQINVLKAYSKFYSLAQSVSLLLRLRLRNAMFRFMGHAIIKEWVRDNHKMSWLRPVST